MYSKVNSYVRFKGIINYHRARLQNIMYVVTNHNKLRSISPFTEANTRVYLELNLPSLYHLNLKCHYNILNYLSHCMMVMSSA